MTKKLRDFDNVIGSITKDEAETILRIYSEYPRSVDSLSIFGEKLSMKIKNLNWMHVEKLVTNAKDVLKESKKTFRDYAHLYNNMTLADAHEILAAKNDLEKKCQFTRSAFCSILNLDEDDTSVLMLTDKANEVIKRHSFNPKVAEFENSMKEAKAVTSNLEKILEERGKTHGNFADVAYISQTIKMQMRGSPRYDKTTLDMRESLDMIAGKMARIVCGNSKEIDHWRDIEGYSALVRKQLEQSEVKHD